VQLAAIGLFNINFSLDGWPRTHDASQRRQCLRKRRWPPCAGSAVPQRNWRPRKLVLVLPDGDQRRRMGETGRNSPDQRQRRALSAAATNSAETPTQTWHQDNPLWFRPEQWQTIDAELLQLQALIKQGYPILNSPEHLNAIRHYVRDPIREKTGETCEVGISNFNVYDDGAVSLCYKMETIGNVKYNSPEASGAPRRRPAPRRDPPTKNA
jgi:hypothetical protein